MHFSYIFYIFSLRFPYYPIARIFHADSAIGTSDSSREVKTTRHGLTRELRNETLYQVCPLFGRFQRHANSFETRRVQLSNYASPGNFSRDLAETTPRLFLGQESGRINLYRAGCMPRRGCNPPLKIQFYPARNPPLDISLSLSLSLSISLSTNVRFVKTLALSARRAVSSTFETKVQRSARQRGGWLRLFVPPLFFFFFLFFFLQFIRELIDPHSYEFQSDSIF